MSIRFSQRILFAALASLLFAASQPALHAAPKKTAKRAAAPAVYKGAITINVQDGAVLFEDNADIVNPPASITKLMTFLVVHDAIKAGQISLDTPATVTAEDSRIGGTQVWLKEKEVFPVEELLYALMIQSANDCANALARTTAGSRAAFVERMNIRARQLGMTNTTFVTPHGLPPPSRKISDGDLSTPRDIALLSRHLIAHTDILKYTSVRLRKFGENVRPQKSQTDMVNHNKLLGKVPGVDGLKTGFTNSAGFCLSATAERDGRRVIVVSMGTPTRIARDARVAELIESAFSKLSEIPLSPVSAPPPVSPVSPPPEPPPAAPANTAAPAPAEQLGEIPRIVFPAPGGSGGSRKK
ncbi:D-alanyl-D-alanine carboxypeptidase [Ereboglobus sp. PH5-10]|uniref:D-alanyl-D-alanine carboxypeptidase family protein n=1 Tax=Ereboglobus sp. PH5-10 TaxID=2940629 RepID=UPI00240591F0|nr:D-alanyl-D-alanine carboxypeptidase family protein [Ereboglobus sp. PH5-10]MDF9827534.1 D-alanyl-D-alanine carboxypeptidase [Ereboglobus sp. PH5-10]